MATEITGFNGSKLHNSGESKQVSVQRTEPSASQEESGRSSTTDTISLTSISLQLETLTNSVANLPVVDAERVENVRTAIDNGSFEVDPSRVALKMIGFESAVYG